MWDEIGRLQFDYLVSQGLEPNHYLLDVGCGSLRGGVHFVRYLERGHYFGVDADRSLLKSGMAELEAAGIADKLPVLKETSEFELPAPQEGFDFALAQSVFTHLPLNTIQRCLVNVSRVLRPDGRFFATFFEDPEGKSNLQPVNQGFVTTYMDRDPYHYQVDAFRWLCDGIDLEVEYIGDWGHPRNQRMLLFRRLSDEPAA